MTTLCRAYTSQSDAHAAVLRLLSVGVPGEDVRVLMGEPVRDGRDGVAGAFAGAAVAADGAVGTFAGEPAARAGGMGGFAGGADRMRAGAFADADRETVTSFPAGVAHMRASGHGRLKRLLVEAGLDAATADADVRALHEGRVLVLVRTGAPATDAATRALDPTA